MLSKKKKRHRKVGKRVARHKILSWQMVTETIDNKRQREGPTRNTPISRPNSLRADGKHKNKTVVCIKMILYDY